MGSNWISWVLTIALVAGLFYAGAHLYDRKNLKSFRKSLTASEPLALKNPPHEIRNRLLAVPRPQDETMEPPESPDCRDYWNALLAVDLDNAETFYPDRLPQSEGCRNIQDPKLRKANENYQASCILSNESDPDAYVRDCSRALVNLRARLTSSVRDHSLDEEFDQSLVLDNLIANWMDFEAGESSLEAVEHSARRMLELAPDYYDPAKVLVLAELRNALSKEPDSVEGDEAWQKAADSQIQAEDFETGDPDLLETSLLIVSRGLRDLEQAEPEAMEMAEAMQESGRGPYYLAAIAWKRGDREQAMQCIREAARREPENSQYLDIVEKLEEGVSDEDLFFPSVSHIRPRLDEIVFSSDGPTSENLAE